jgi:YHS domain-containing protein
MTVEQETAVSVEWSGTTFHFCASGCRDEFIRSPSKFTGNAEPISAAIGVLNRAS